MSGQYNNYLKACMYSAVPNLWYTTLGYFLVLNMIIPKFRALYRTVSPISKSCKFVGKLVFFRKKITKMWISRTFLVFFLLFYISKSFKTKIFRSFKTVEHILLGNIRDMAKIIISKWSLEYGALIGAIEFWISFQKMQFSWILEQLIFFRKLKTTDFRNFSMPSMRSVFRRSFWYIYLFYISNISLRNVFHSYCGKNGTSRL